MGTLAERQLAAWEAIAEDWPAVIDGRVVRCAECGMGIRLLTDIAGVMFTFTHEQMLALTVLHLRNFHPGLDPDPA
jgi:hypothetical protein